MTAPRHGLGAHDHQPLLFCQFYKGLQVPRKLCGLRVVGVAAESSVSPAPIRRLRTCAAEASEARDVRTVDTSDFKRSWKGIAVKLRVVAGARYGTHVNEPGQRVRRGQRNKLGERSRRMTNGQYDGLKVLLHHCLCKPWLNAWTKNFDSCTQRRHRLPLEPEMVLDPRKAG